MSWVEYFKNIREGDECPCGGKLLYNHDQTKLICGKCGWKVILE